MAAVAGGSCRQGAGRGCDCAEHPAGRFRAVSCQRDLAVAPEGVGVSAGWRWPSLSNRDGRVGLGIIASHRISSATRWEAEAAKCRHGGPFVRAGRDPQSKNDHLGICL